MSINTFIFSEKRTDRIKRHIIFWILWWLYFGMLHAANPFLKEAESYFRRTQFTIAESFLLIIPQVIIAYLILYIVVPMYTRKRQIIKPIIVGIMVCLWIPEPVDGSKIESANIRMASPA
jgi:hypothetical protein